MGERDGEKREKRSEESISRSGPQGVCHVSMVRRESGSKDGKRRKKKKKKEKGEK